MADRIDGSVYDSAYKGDLQHVKVLVDKDVTLATKKDRNERLLLHWAAVGGHEPIARYLLEKGSPVDPVDDSTPLMLAAAAGRSEVVALLIGLKADVNASNQEGHSALQLSASKGWQEVVQILLTEGANVNIKDKRGATPLHRVASQGRTAIVTRLLEVPGIDVAAVDAEGNTALHLACEEDRRHEARLLVQHGASLTQKNKEEKTPLDLCEPGLARQLREVSEL